MLIAKSIFDFKESRSFAELLNAFAVKNAGASSIAELTFLPVDKRVWVVEASACERDARAFLAGLSLHQGPTFPTSHRQAPHALSYRRRAALMDALAHEYRTLQALAKRAENYALDARRRAPAWAFAQRVLVRRVRKEEWENSVVRARVRSKKSGHH